MAGRTYRYFKKEPLFPFGFGLSYTRFSYSGLTMPEAIKTGEELAISVEVKNSGPRDGEEVVQVYLSRPESTSPANPIRWLVACRRIFLRAGEKQRITLTVRPREMMTYDSNGQPVIEPGVMVVSVGGQQPGFKGRLSASTTPGPDPKNQNQISGKPHSDTVEGERGRLVTGPYSQSEP